jgi:hypothetical protein
MTELRFTDNTQQFITENFKLAPDQLAKVNFAMNLSGTTHAVETLQSHCELSVDDAETLALALQLLSTVKFNDSMIVKPKSVTSADNLTKSTLYVRNLPLTVSLEELSSTFEAFGQVKDTRLQKDKGTGEFTGYAYWCCL